MDLDLNNSRAWFFNFQRCSSDVTEQLVHSISSGKCETRLALMLAACTQSMFHGFLLDNSSSQISSSSFPCFTLAGGFCNANGRENLLIQRHLLFVEPWQQANHFFSWVYLLYSTCDQQWLTKISHWHYKANQVQH